MSTPDTLRGRWFSSEMLVAARFASLGYTVSLPLIPSPYDLIVDMGLLYRVQVKSLGWTPPRLRKLGKGDAACYRTELLRGRTTKKARLLPAEFDVLCAVCEPDRIYVLPTSCLLSPTHPTRLIRALRIKLPTGTRHDTLTAAARWEPYLNQFTLP